ncbi:cytochrome P450 [Nocardiopsis sp. YSL2]|uniref:cytochrome P450 n=1 Tax=Nocardiopsis sp. YSL2 TaxID=2939492 RepID=UPI0026F4352F|nr:cytochrome P450 [Nocardiopsis sp. YSL2]
MSTFSDVDAIDINDVDGFWSKPIEYRHAAFDALRARSALPFYPEPDFGGAPRGPGYYALTRMDDVLQVTRDANRFISGRGTGSVVDLPAEMMAEFGESIITMDGPRHGRLRRIVSRVFTPKMVNALMDNVSQVATEIVDEVIERGECDAVTDISAKLPLRVICDMMGIPRSQHEFVDEQTNLLLGLADPDFVAEHDDPLGVMFGASRALADLMHGLAEQRATNPTDDLISTLLNAEIEGEALTPTELASFFILLVSAGNETTRNAISWGIELLTRFPEQRAVWLSDIGGVTPTAVEEIVRWSSPVMCQRRTVAEDAEPVEIGGRRLGPGDKVLMFHWAANRDPRYFDDPARFDVLRDPNPHVGYGGPGPHFCLGAHLARLELTVIFRQILTRIPDIRVAGEPVRLKSSLVNGIKHLPVTFTPGGPDRGTHRAAT